MNLTIRQNVWGGNAEIRLDVDFERNLTLVLAFDCGDSLPGNLFSAIDSSEQDIVVMLLIHGAETTGEANYSQEGCTIQGTPGFIAGLCNFVVTKRECEILIFIL